MMPDVSVAGAAKTCTPSCLSSSRYGKSSALSRRDDANAQAHAAERDAAVVDSAAGAVLGVTVDDHAVPGKVTEHEDIDAVADS